MAQVVISPRLEDEINKKFKGESVDIFELLYSLEENPTKGKALGSVGGIVIKELKYKSFRFYFILEGFKIKVFTQESLTDLLIRFVRMSDKKSQQHVIHEIRTVLSQLGPEGFR